MSVTLPGSTPAAVSEACNLPAFAQLTSPAPVSNSSVRSPSRTSSGWMLRCSTSVGSPLADNSAATSSVFWPTPKVLPSFGVSIVPSRNATASSVPILKRWMSAFSTGAGTGAAGAGVSAAGAGVAACSSDAGFAQPSMAPASNSETARERELRVMANSGVGPGRKSHRGRKA